MQLLNRIREHVTPEESAESANNSIPPAKIYSILANERRRIIVEYLANHDDVDVDVSEIADHIVEQTGCSRNAAYISCIQNHCPVCETAGILDYRERDKVVVRLDALDTVYKAHKQVEKVAE